jgi:hypothetical protein
MKTIGSAFVVDRSKASKLGLGTTQGLEQHIQPYLSGRDLASSSRDVYVIDFFGLSREEVKKRFPTVYQHLLTRAKPERDHNRNRFFQENWWVIGHPRPVFREFTRGLGRFIATIETSKHRFFTFLPKSTIPDSTLVTFGFDDGLALGFVGKVPLP